MNYSDLPNDVIRHIISHTRNELLPTIRIISRNHYSLIEEAYDADILQILNLTSKSVMEEQNVLTLSNLTSNIKSIMMRHQNDSRFNQLLHEKFPLILKSINNSDIRGPVLSALGIDQAIPYYDTALKALYHVSMSLTYAYYSDGYSPFVLLTNSFLYKALRDKLNLSNSELMIGTILWTRNALDEIELDIIQRNDNFIDRVALIYPFQPQNIFCSVWSQCISDIIKVFEAYSHKSLSFRGGQWATGHPFFKWIEIITQVAYYHYQRGEIIMYQQLIGSLTNIFYGSNTHGKRLLVYLKSWQKKGQCVYWQGSTGHFVHMEATAAINDGHFVSMMIDDLRVQREDWEKFNLYQLNEYRISYFAQICFWIWILLTVMTLGILCLILTPAVMWITHEFTDHMQPTSNGTCVNIICDFMVGFSFGWFIGIFIYPMALGWFIQWVLRKLKLKKCYCCTACFNHPTLFKITIACLCIIWNCIFFLQFIIVPPP